MERRRTQLLLVLLVWVVAPMLGCGRPATPWPTPTRAPMYPTPPPTNTAPPPTAATLPPTAIPWPPTATPVPTMPGRPTPDPTPANAGAGTTWDWSDGSVMVYVPPGTFLMGSMPQQVQALDTPDWFDAEIPRHEVHLDGFWLDRTEVTNALYRRCVDSGTCSLPADLSSCHHSHYYGQTGFEEYPVIHVNWFQAQNYCLWAGKRLPTEAEWEKAARGTKGLTYPWGEGIGCSLANYADCNQPLTPVGSYPKGQSPYGSLDMAGNVREWVADWYDRGYYAVSPAENPRGPDQGERRVFRGGSFVNVPSMIRTALRDASLPSQEDCALGFRCAYSVPGG